MNETYLKIYNTLQAADNKANISSRNEIEFELNNQGMISSLKESIDIENIRNDTYRFDTTNSEFLLFWDKEEFGQSFQSENRNKNIGILNLETNFPFFYDYKLNKVYTINDKFEYTELIDNFLFSNVFSYQDFLTFLESKQEKGDQFYYFIDAFDNIKRNIILTMIKKEGKLIIPYPKEIPLLILNEKIDYSQRFNRFKETFKDPKLPTFIKPELFTYLSQEATDKRFLVFIDKLNNIIDSAEQNFFVYLQNLSLDNFKRDYIDYKDKYLTQLREILGKVSGQVIALPVSVSAAIIASYSSTTIPDITLISIIIAFFVYTCFAVFLIRLLSQDIADIKQRFLIEFKKLKEGEFFSKYPDEITPFEEVKKNVEDRIWIMNATIKTYFFLLVFTNSIIIGTLFFKILQSLFFSLLPLVINVVIQLIIFFLWKSK